MPRNFTLSDHHINIIRIYWKLDDVRDYSNHDEDNNSITGKPIYGRVQDFGQWSSTLSGRGDWNFSLWDGDRVIRTLIRTYGYNRRVELVRVDLNQEEERVEWLGYLESNISWAEDAEELRINCIDAGQGLGDSPSMPYTDQYFPFANPTTLGKYIRLAYGEDTFSPSPNYHCEGPVTQTTSRVPYWEGATFTVEDASEFPQNEYVSIYVGPELMGGEFDGNEFTTSARSLAYTIEIDGTWFTNQPEYSHDVGAQVTRKRTYSRYGTSFNPTQFSESRNYKIWLKGEDEQLYPVDPRFYEHYTRSIEWDEYVSTKEVSSAQFRHPTHIFQWRPYPKDIPAHKPPFPTTVESEESLELIVRSDSNTPSPIISEDQPYHPAAIAFDIMDLSIVSKGQIFAPPLLNFEAAINQWPNYRVSFSIIGDKPVYEVVEDLLTSCRSGVDWTVGGRVVPLTNALYTEHGDPVDIDLTTDDRILLSYEINLPGSQVEETERRINYIDRSGREKVVAIRSEDLAKKFGYHPFEWDAWMYADEDMIKSVGEWLHYRYKYAHDDITLVVSTVQALPGDLIRLPNGRVGWIKSVRCDVARAEWELSVQAPSHIKGSLPPYDYDTSVSTDVDNEPFKLDALPPIEDVDEAEAGAWDEGDEDTISLPAPPPEVEYEPEEPPYVLRPLFKDPEDFIYIYRQAQPVKYEVGPYDPPSGATSITKKIQTSKGHVVSGLGLFGDYVYSTVDDEEVVGLQGHPQITIEDIEIADINTIILKGALTNFGVFEVDGSITLRIMFQKLAIDPETEPGEWQILTSKTIDRAYWDAEISSEYVDAIEITDFVDISGVDIVKFYIEAEYTLEAVWEQEAFIKGEQPDDAELDTTLDYPGPYRDEEELPEGIELGSHQDVALETDVDPEGNIFL